MPLRRRLLRGVLRRRPRRLVLDLHPAAVRRGNGDQHRALIAPFAFLGPRDDPLVEKFYTSVENRDLFRVRPLRALRSEAVADNSRLEQLVTDLLSPRVVGEVAAEHARGRRLYVGTTELESRRFVVWDLGAIAAKGTEEDLRLFRQVVLGSAAIPGFFPPVRIPVGVNGERLIERHVDGGVSQALFFRPPFVPPDRCADPAARRWPAPTCTRSSPARCTRTRTRRGRGRWTWPARAPPRSSTPRPAATW